MNLWKLVIENPSLAHLCATFPTLKRFLSQGFETEVHLHAADVVGLVNPNTGQALRVNVLNGDIIPA